MGLLFVEGRMMVLGNNSLSMIVDAEHGPLSERLLKEDASLVLDAGSMGEEHGPLSERMLKEDVLDAGSVGEEDFAPVLKKPGKENQDVRLYIFFLIILLVAILTVVGKVVLQDMWRGDKPLIPVEGGLPQASYSSIKYTGNGFVAKNFREFYTKLAEREEAEEDE